jgi:hypothetical protein
MGWLCLLLPDVERRVHMPAGAQTANWHLVRSLSFSSSHSLSLCRRARQLGGGAKWLPRVGAAAGYRRFQRGHVFTRGEAGFCFKTIVWIPLQRGPSGLSSTDLELYKKILIVC